MKCIAKSRIRLLKGGWKVAAESDESKYVKKLIVKLFIDGDDENGYHLIMEPDSCFAADSHYESIEEAKKGAYASFGVSDSDWV